MGVLNSKLKKIVRTQKPSLGQQTGAATIELAFAMMWLFVFFAIYMIFVQIFIAQERSVFAGFTAARTYAVQGSGPALNAAVSVAPGASVSIPSGDHVEIKTHVPIPAGLGFLTQGQGRFTVTYRSPTKREPQEIDDNPYPY